LLYRAHTNGLYKPIKPALDDAEGGEGGEYGSSFGPADAQMLDITDTTVQAIHAWLETDDLYADENLAQRLFALFVGIFDLNQNGVLDADEEAVLDIILNTAWDYFTGKGISDADCNALLNNWDGDAASRVFDVLVAEMPDGEEAADTDIESFVWGDDQEPMLDSALGGRLKALGGAFKKVFAIRHGKKVRINKRITGTAHLTSKQKAAVRRLHSKRMSAASIIKRLKSMRLSRRMGLSGGG
jgi:hypothetical protein